MNRFIVLLGIVVVAAGLATAPIPLTVNAPDLPSGATIYPNLLFAVPLLLLGALLLLYGLTVGHTESQSAR